MIFLSIVIPVYNVEKYIKDCIESCIENIGMQSEDVEIIVVNDGTKDNSMSIVKKLTNGLNYVKILDQENMGLSMARNNGLYEAAGDFIWFVDSDDYLPKGILSSILLRLKKNSNLDILDLKYKSVDEFDKREIVDTNKQKPEVDNIHIVSGKEKFVAGFEMPVQFHVFRKAFLLDNKLEMFRGIYHEDCEFTPRAMWMANKVAVLDEMAYYYRIRRNSIKTTVNPKKGVDNIIVSKRLKDFFDNQNMSKIERDIANGWISMFFCNGLNNAINASIQDKKIINDAVQDNLEILEVLKKSVLKKYKILGYIGSLMPRKIVSVYLTMMKLK